MRSLQITCLLALAAPVHAAITGLTAQVSNAQILITYTAPNDDGCTVEASESDTYSPLVNDVDSSLFDNADNDVARYPSVNTGKTARTFVIGVHGKYVRTSDMGSVLSRALAANKLHHIRLTCGADTATTTATTVSQPFGSTYGSPMQLSDVDDTRVLRPAWPGTRNARLIDPWSGSELFRVSTIAESTGGSYLGSGGSVTACSNKIITNVAFAGGVFCKQDGSNGNALVNLYVIRMGSDGNMESRYIGYIPAISDFDGGHAVVFSQVGFDANNEMTWFAMGASGRVLMKYVYTGDFSDKTAMAPYNIGADTTQTTLASNLASEVNTFADAHAAEWGGVTFDEVNFACTFPGILQNSKYDGSPLLFVYCRQGQDTAAWIAVYKDGTGIIGAYPTWAFSSDYRWCGVHSHEEIGQQGGLFLWTPHAMTDVSTGPNLTTVIGALDAMVTTITIDGMPVRGGSFQALGPLKSGDFMIFTDSSNEAVQLTADPVDIGGGHFTIAVNRAVGVLGGFAGSPSSHVDGTQLKARCSYMDIPDGQASFQPMWWPEDDPYMHDPHFKFIGSHEGIRPGIAADGQAYEHFTPPSLPNDFTYTGNDWQFNPTFSGYKLPGYCCGWETYPNPDMTQAPTLLQRRIVLDARNFQGAQAGIALVAGKTQTYKLTLGRSTDLGYSNTIGWRYVPVVIEGTYHSGARIMPKNYSGVSSALPDTGSGFCIALHPDECVTGSVENDVYVSDPYVTLFSCSNALGAALTALDICGFERSPSTMGPMEINTTPTGVLTFSHRQYLMPNTFSNSPRDIPGYIRGLPDGSAIYYLEQDENGLWQTFLLKRQPTEVGIDDVDRTGYLNQPCAFTGTVPMTAARAVCKFGYSLDDAEEWHANPNRPEDTYAVKSTIDATFPTKPYLFESELTSSSGVSVTGGSTGTVTVAIPDTPVRRVGWYSMVFRDSGGSVVETEAPQAFLGGGPVGESATPTSTRHPASKFKGGVIFK